MKATAPLIKKKMKGISNEFSNFLALSVYPDRASFIKYVDFFFF
ncbi:hypothetical protein BSM4216_0624 [Bacillus smithii]|nr:hypothetical protein BSM4216_0624 [Bacillus smithii]